ncbi:MAG: ribonuclease P protein component 1 [Candidatus Odinarchaeia archaeon]
MKSDNLNLYLINLIGKKIKIINSSDPSLIGLTGIIKDETRNMLMINVENRMVKIPKKIVQLKIEINGEKMEVNGIRILGRPDERLKKIIRRK